MKILHPLVRMGMALVLFLWLLRQVKATPLSHKGQWNIEIVTIIITINTSCASASTCTHPVPVPYFDWRQGNVCAQDPIPTNTTNTMQQPCPRTSACQQKDTPFSLWQEHWTKISTAVKNNTKFWFYLLPFHWHWWQSISKANLLVP